MKVEILKVLRIVTLASSTGKYGGPYDTASSQSRLVAGQDDIEVTLIAGHLPGDTPAHTSPLYQMIAKPVRRILKASGFTTCISLAMLVETFCQVRKADVVHISYARELIPLSSALITIALRKPLVIQPHGMLTSRTSRLHRLVDVLARPIFKRADTVIALTDVEKDQLQAWAGNTTAPLMKVCGNPLPYESNEERALGSNKAVFIARLESRKRVCDFVEAGRIAYANGWDELYDIIGPDQGDGPLAELGMQTIPNVTYAGSVPAQQIDKILANAAVFVLTSENEPWGNVLVSALVKGVPVVVTRSAALASEIEDNCLGIVVQDQRPEEVAKAVHKIMSSEWRQAEEEDLARRFVAARFKQSSIQLRLSTIYKEVRQAK